MIKSKIFVRFALLGTLISAIMLIVSGLTTQWMRDLVFDEPFRDRGPFRAVEHIIENMPPEQRVQGLRDLQFHSPRTIEYERGHNDDEITPSSTPNPFFDFILLSADGQVLFPATLDSSRTTNLDAIVRDLTSKNEIEETTSKFLVRRLVGTPVQYLARGARFHPPPPPLMHLIALMSIQMLAIMVAVFLTLGAVLYSLRRRAVEAEQVMRELTAGNLKARIPIGKMDEIGQVSSSFNKMADEIEHLIDHLKKTEHARRDLLRQLAHDLRTPVASLKSLIETVNERAAQLSAEKKKELLDLALREADYFEGLVDDLLFLGRVQEPMYKPSDRGFDLRELIRLEVEAISHRHSHVELDFNDGPMVNVAGDPGLIKRLVRNALENAASFAKSRVDVHLRADSRGVEILVSDDGPGFDAASLVSFGQRKYSRAISTAPSKRISIGLGSVIMKSIVDAYRGELTASNRSDDSSRDVAGANVLIRLPLI